MVLNLGIFIFSQNFPFRPIQGADFKYENMFLKVLSQKYLNKAFLVPKLGIFIFLQNFAVTVLMLLLEGVDVKYHISFLKFYPKNTHI